MSDVAVYYCALSSVQVGPKTTPVVLASDYKSLAAENAALRSRLAALEYAQMNWTTHKCDASVRLAEAEALLREAQEFVVPSSDSGCPQGECAECDMHRLAVRIDAHLSRKGESHAG